MLDAACECWTLPVIAGHGSKPNTRALLAVAGTKDGLVATAALQAVKRDPLAGWFEP